MVFVLAGCGPNVRGTQEEHKSNQTFMVNDSVPTDSIQTFMVNDSVPTDSIQTFMVNDSVPTDSIQSLMVNDSVPADSIQPLMVSDSVPADSVLTFTVNGVSFNMVAVEGGTFTMGATSEQQRIAYDWEKPTHSVTLSDFSIGETEVTEELWYAVMGESQYSRCKNKNLPVAHVSWNKCQEFITQLNQLTGKNFRLPTEAEWEYAARGGKESMGYRYAGSNTLSEVAWYTGNSENVTHTVKQKQPNELGLYDMSGNVWEWCQDWYGDYYSFEETNPTGPPAASYRVRRGGGSCYNARDCRTSVRDRYNPAYSENNLGLRLALTIKVLPSTKPVVTKKITTQTFAVNGVSFTMVDVEGGTFMMGANNTRYNESPSHSVTLSDFSIGETEVTQELWQAVMGNDPSYFPRFEGPQLPVEQVSWNDCQEFITQLNQLTGKNFRLPTEAEWEYAARGGNKSKGYKYAGSNNIDDVAWYWTNGSSKTHPVKQLLRNELFLYDMSGNVWEWCQDWYGSYSSGAQTNPTGPERGFERVYRGGSWGGEERFCRVLERGQKDPKDSFKHIGLRLAL